MIIYIFVGIVLGILFAWLILTLEKKIGSAVKNMLMFPIQPLEPTKCKNFTEKTQDKIVSILFITPPICR